MSTFDRTQPMGNDDGRAVLHRVPQCVLNKPLAFAVQSRSCFVQHQDCRISDNGSSDSEVDKNSARSQNTETGADVPNTLSLSSTELASSLTYNGVVARWKLHDEVMSVCLFGSFEYESPPCTLSKKFIRRPCQPNLRDHHEQRTKLRLRGESPPQCSQRRLSRTARALVQPSLFELVAIGHSKTRSSARQVRWTPCSAHCIKSGSERWAKAKSLTRIAQ